MHPALKGAVERLLVHGGPASIARATMRGRALVLAYHNVLPDGAEPCGDHPLHLPRTRFVAQLEALTRHTDVIPLAELSRSAWRRGRPRAVITFDDAYAGAVTVGIEELARRGLPATIFVAPGLLGGCSFWWDSLAASPGLDERLRARAINELQGEAGAIKRWAATGRLPSREPPAYARSASEGDLEAAVRRPGITVGSHSWSHPNLARLTARELERELVQSRDWLADRFGPAFVPWLSYPYGSRSATVAGAARAAGYEGAFRIEGGWMAATSHTPHDLPRLSVGAGLSDAGFGLRIAGLIRR
jgi:peptidoglycan/xylan/chitin deacetylase (PgdA/CDA1 family)